MTTTCRWAVWFGKRCSKTARWVVRINDDPDTDLVLCPVHADLSVRRFHPTPVTKTELSE